MAYIQLLYVLLFFYSSLTFNCFARYLSMPLSFEIPLTCIMLLMKWSVTLRLGEIFENYFSIFFCHFILCIILNLYITIGIKYNYYTQQTPFELSHKSRGLTSNHTTTGIHAQKGIQTPRLLTFQADILHPSLRADTFS